MTNQELSALVAKAQAGSKQAMNDLIENCYQDLFFYAFKTVQNEDLAADITQDGCMDIIAKLSELREPAAFSAWARRIIHTRCSRYFRQTREITVEEDENGETIFDRLPDESEGVLPEQVQEDKEFRRTMQEMLDSLPTEQRTALLLYYYEKLSVGQIAQIQGVSDGTVKSRLNYGRKAVKTKVEEYEKKTGVRLHSLAPLPLLLLFLLGREREAVVAKCAPAISAIPATVAATATGAGTAVAAGAAAGAGIGLKIIAGIAAVAAAVGITVGSIAIAKNDTNDDPETDATNIYDIIYDIIPESSTYFPEETTPAAAPQIAVGHWESLTNPGMEIEILEDGSVQINGEPYFWTQGELTMDLAWSWLKIMTPAEEWVYNAYLMKMTDGRLQLVLADPVDASIGFANSVVVENERIALFYRPAEYEGYELIELTTENILDYLEYQQEFIFMENLDNSVSDNVYLSSWMRFTESVGSASYAVVDFIYEMSEVSVQIDMDSRSGSIKQTLSTTIVKDSDTKWEDGRDFNTEIIEFYPVGSSDWITRPEDHSITVFETTMNSYRVTGAAKVKGYVLVRKPAQ